MYFYIHLSNYISFGSFGSGFFLRFYLLGFEGCCCYCYCCCCIGYDWVYYCNWGKASGVGRSYFLPLRLPFYGVYNSSYCYYYYYYYYYYLGFFYFDADDYYLFMISYLLFIEHWFHAHRSFLLQYGLLR